MTEDKGTMQSSNFKDRKAGLIVFGILEIIFGGFCALIVPLMILSMIASKSSGMPMRPNMIIPGVLFYVLLAVWFIWMGVGSITARRWARALLLVSSWLWLICGISAFIAMLIFIPNMYDQMGQKGQMSQGTVAMMKFVVFGFMTVSYVIIPGVLILFYGSKNVKATCEFIDSRVRWTDKCPLPVLALSLMFGLWAGSMLLAGFYGWVIPFFGNILSGMTGAGVTLVGILLVAYVAWGTYKLSIKAWWCAVLMTIAWTVSIGITFSRVSLLELYEKMNFPEQQLHFMKQFSIPLNSTMVLYSVLWGVGLLGYLLYVRRYFPRFSKQEKTS